MFTAEQFLILESFILVLDMSIAKVYLSPIVESSLFHQIRIVI